MWKEVPMQRMWRELMILCALLAFGALTGCSEDDNPTSPNNTGASGNVSKAAVAGASVNIHAINTNGAVGGVVSGPFTTDANGNWSGSFPNSQSGPKVLVSTGGQFVDEATDATIHITAGKQMHGVLTSAPSVVTPMTEATFAAVQAKVAGGGTLQAVLDSASLSSTQAFGFDFATTVPSIAATATTNQKRYAALLGGLSTMLDANPALTAFVNTQKMDLVLAVAHDMADGKLDGLSATGGAIQVPTDSAGTSVGPLPALSATNLSAWLTASNNFAASEPNLTGITFDVNTAWTPAGGSTTGSPPSGSVTFTGTGAAMLQSNTFTPTSSSIVSGNQMVWNDDGHNVQILIVPLAGQSGVAQTLTVTYATDPGAVWTKFSATGVTGVTIGPDVTTFSNAIADEISGGATSLTLSGSLANPAAGLLRASNGATRARARH
jgi:hypothetical protein